MKCIYAFIAIATVAGFVIERYHFSVIFLFLPFLPVLVEEWYSFWVETYVEIFGSFRGQKKCDNPAINWELHNTFDGQH